MKGALLFLILILCVNSIFCQETLIKGKVIDDKLSDLIAVNVLNLTSHENFLTDKYGMFEINSNLGDTLEFSFVGLTSEKLVITNNANIKLIMIDKSVNCLGAEWTKHDYKKANRQIQKRLKALYLQADKNNIWQDLK